MSKYLIFIRKQPAQIKGKGADKGDVISIRLSTTPATKFEQEHCDIIEKEMTEAQMVVLRNKIRPRTSFVSVTTPPNPKKNPNAHKAWELANKETQNKLPNYGLKKADI